MVDRVVSVLVMCVILRMVLILWGCDFWEWFSLSAVVVLLLGVPNFLCLCWCVLEIVLRFLFNFF